MEDVEVTLRLPQEAYFRRHPGDVRCTLDQRIVETMGTMRLVLQKRGHALNVEHTMVLFVLQNTVRTSWWRATSDPWSRLFVFPSCRRVWKTFRPHHGPRAHLGLHAAQRQKFAEIPVPLQTRDDTRGSDSACAARAEPSTSGGVHTATPRAEPHDRENRRRALSHFQEATMAAVQFILL